MQTIVKFAVSVLFVLLSLVTAAQYPEVTASLPYEAVSSATPQEPDTRQERINTEVDQCGTNFKPL